MERLDFSKPFDFSKEGPLLAYFHGQAVYFTRYGRYEGPLTMQYLPFGGVQSLFHGLLILHVNGGYLAVYELSLNGEKTLTSKEFIAQYGAMHLMNQLFE